MSDVIVSFGGDTAQLRDQLELAQRSMSDSTDRMRQSADAAAPSYQKLQEQIDKLNESSERTAKSTEGLLRFVELGTILKGLGVLWDANTSLSHGFYSGLGMVSTGVDSVSHSLADGIKNYLEYAKSQATVAQWLPLVEVRGHGVSAMIGNLVKDYEQWSNRAELANDGMAHSVVMASAAAGQYQRLSVAAIAAGGSLEKFYADQGSNLMRRGFSESDSEAILKMIAAVPGASLDAQAELVKFTTQMSASGEEAKAYASKLTGALQDPSANGGAYIDSIKGLPDSYREQFDAAKQVNDQHAMTTVILSTVLDKQKALGVAATDHVRALERAKELEKEKGAAESLYAELFMGASAKEKQSAQEQQDALGNQLRLHNSIIAALDRERDTTEQVAHAAKGIVDAMNPYVSQLDAIQAKMATLQSASASGAGESLRSIISQAESANRNIRQITASGGKGPASGWFQIEDDTWSDFKSKVEEAKKYKTAMDAPADVQWAVAQQIPLERWAPATVAAVKAKYPSADESKTVGQLSSQLNPADTKASVASEEMLAEQAQKVRDAMAGGNAVALEQVNILQRSAQGQADSVKSAEAIRDAWKQVLSTHLSAGDQTSARAGLAQAEITLAEARRNVAAADLALEKNKTDVISEQFAIAKKKYALDMEAANGDPVKQKAAKLTLDQASDANDTENDAKSKAIEDAKYQVALLGLQRRQALEKQDQELHQLTAQGKLNTDLAFEAEREKLEQNHLQFNLNQEVEGTSGYMKAQEAMNIALAQGIANRQQIITNDTKAIAQSYTQAFEKIGNTVSSSIMGMIQGHENFRQMLGKITSQILGDFISMGVKQVADWAATQTMKLVQTVSGQGAQTAAVVAGQAAQTGAVVAGTAAGLAAQKVAAVSTISSDAARAGAGAYASTVQIPILGPILAPAAAAVAFGAVEAFGAFDTGAYSVPHDQLAYIHSGEMIVPSRGGVAEEFRGMMDGKSEGNGGGSGDTHVHFAVSAIDHSSVKRWFGNNSENILKAIGSGIKGGDHLGIRNLAR